MARRYSERYLANVKTREVHDLDNETSQCQIDEIIQAGNEKPYNSLQAAHNDGFDNCHYCIGNSKR